MQRVTYINEVACIYKTIYILQNKQSLKYSMVLIVRFSLILNKYLFHFRKFRKFAVFSNYEIFELLQIIGYF